MKLYTWGAILYLILFIHVGQLKAQSILKLTEITTGGKVLDIKPVFDKKDTTILKRYPNIDINSSIKIEVNTEQIRQEAYNWIPVKTDLPVSQMKSISDFLSNRLELIKAIRFTSENLLEKQKVLQSFSNQTAPVFTILSKLESSSPLRNKLNLILSERERDASVTYNKIFNLLEAEINSIRSEYKSAIEQNKVFFRMGTFINNTPIHLEGFDSYKEGDYFFVPRFVTNVPEDQKQSFEKYQKIASQANENALKVFSDKLREVTNPVLDSLKQLLQIRFIEPLSSFETALENLDTISEDIKNGIAQNKEEITNFLASIELLISTSKDVTQPEFVNKMAELVIRIINDYKTLDQSLKSSILKLENSGSLSKFQSALAELKTSYTSGMNVVTNQIGIIKGFYDSKNFLQISLTKKIEESLLKLGDEVTKLPLNNIPEHTTLDLRRTTVRNSGDRLSFKAVLAKASPEKDKISEEKTIEFTSIGLYKIGLHNSIQAVLILADNLSGDSGSEKQFQFDPSYSVLFKLGSRNNSFYNDFVELGVGVNMATLDFNNDDNPEVGMGLVFSAFKDYLQVGYGRNFGVDKNYWFFGIRLPFLGMNSDGKSKMLPAEQ